MTRRRIFHDSANDQTQLPRPIPAVPSTNVLHQLFILQEATTADLKQRWRELFGKEPPVFNRGYLKDRLTYRIQEIANGGLKSETVVRLEALGERLDGGNITLRRIRADDRPLVGTQLMRDHGGYQHIVTVLAEGFEYQGRPYRSLSAIARAISGTRWNGWTFFGLNRQRGGA